MTEYKLKDGWQDKAKEYIQIEGKRKRRMSRYNEKLLLKILNRCFYSEEDIKNNIITYYYRG